MDIAYLIITHNRIDQAKAQIELVRNLYSKFPLLSNLDIFHAYNGDESKYPTPHLNEKIIRRKNLGHLHGACALLNSGINQILSEDKKYDYIIVASGDVWFVNPELIENSIKKMNANNKLLCTSIWFISAYATEFFIIDSSLAKKVFPLDLVKYEKAHPIQKILSKLIMFPIIEKMFREQVKLNANLESDVILFDNMKYIFYNNRWIRKKARYYSPHSERDIGEVVREENLSEYGKTFSTNTMTR